MTNNIKESMSSPSLNDKLSSWYMFEHEDMVALDYRYSFIPYVTIIDIGNGYSVSQDDIDSIVDKITSYSFSEVKLKYESEEHWIAPQLEFYKNSNEVVFQYADSIGKNKNKELDIKYFPKSKDLAQIIANRVNAAINDAKINNVNDKDDEKNFVLKKAIFIDREAQSGQNCGADTVENFTKMSGDKAIPNDGTHREVQLLQASKYFLATRTKELSKMSADIDNINLELQIYQESVEFDVNRQECKARLDSRHEVKKNTEEAIAKLLKDIDYLKETISPKALQYDELFDKLIAAKKNNIELYSNYIIDHEGNMQDSGITYLERIAEIWKIEDAFDAVSLVEEDVKDNNNKRENTKTKTTISQQTASQNHVNYKDNLKLVKHFAKNQETIKRAIEDISGNKISYWTNELLKTVAFGFDLYTSKMLLANNHKDSSENAPLILDMIFTTMHKLGIMGENNSIAKTCLFDTLVLNSYAIINPMNAGISIAADFGKCYMQNYISANAHTEDASYYMKSANFALTLISAISTVTGFYNSMQYKIIAPLVIALAKIYYSFYDNSMFDVLSSIKDNAISGIESIAEKTNNMIEIVNDTIGNLLNKSSEVSNIIMSTLYNGATNYYNSSVVNINTILYGTHDTIKAFIEDDSVIDNNSSLNFNITHYDDILINDIATNNGNYTMFDLDLYS